MSPRLSAVLSRWVFWFGMVALTLPFSYAAVELFCLLSPYLLPTLDTPRQPLAHLRGTVCAGGLFLVYAFATVRFTIGQWQYFRTCYEHCKGRVGYCHCRKIYLELAGLYVRALCFWGLAFTFNDPQVFFAIYMGLMIADCPFLLYGVTSHTTATSYGDHGVELKQDGIIFAANRWLYNNLFCALLLLILLHLRVVGLIAMEPFIVLGFIVSMGNGIADVYLTPWVYEQPLPWLV